ncbi:MAG: PQQ-binding-like beta-propeller repeat protein [Jatrophihabitantaceae bacterium]
MSVDEVHEPSTAEASAERSRAALQRYGARLRPWRIGYAIALVLVVAVVVVVVRIAYSHGEISHATLRTVKAPPPSVALKTPSQSLTPLWRSADRTAIGTPYWGGTVITYGAHGVRGRDARTGAVTWSYTRNDRIVCQAAQLQGVTIAIFQVNGNCDELTALDSNTGARKWTRTLDKDGHELNGTPAYDVTPYTLMLTTPSVIYAVEPVGGLDRWVFGQQGCTIRGAVLGSSGALISQSCTRPNCTDVKFCGPGQQLLLRDSTAPENTDSSSNKGNPDQIKWNLLGDTRRAGTADQVVSALDSAADTLDVLDPAKGSAIVRLSLGSPPTGIAVTIPTAQGDVLWVAGVAYAIDQGATAFTWTAAASSPPTVTSTNNSVTPDLQASVMAVPTAGGIALLDPRDGRVARTFSVAAPAPGSLVYPLGTGFVIAGPSTTVYR